MEWDEEQKHSVVCGKLVDLDDEETATDFVPGAKVKCRLSQGVFSATVLAAGVLVIVHFACVCVVGDKFYFSKINVCR